MFYAEQKCTFDSLVRLDSFSFHPRVESKWRSIVESHGCLDFKTLFSPAEELNERESERKSRSCKKKDLELMRSMTGKHVPGPRLVTNVSVDPGMSVPTCILNGIQCIRRRTW